MNHISYLNRRALGVSVEEDLIFFLKSSTQSVVRHASGMIPHVQCGILTLSVVVLTALICTKLTNPIVTEKGKRWNPNNPGFAYTFFAIGSIRFSRRRWGDRMWTMTHINVFFSHSLMISQRRYMWHFEWNPKPTYWSFIPLHRSNLPMKNNSSDTEQVLCNIQRREIWSYKLIDFFSHSERRPSAFSPPIQVQDFGNM